MPNTVLGKVSVTPKGAWSGSSSFDKLDIVSNGGNSYIALQNVPSGTALSNSSYWLMIAEKGDKGNTGEIAGASASISGGYGTPGVSVTSGGTSTERSFAFAFSNLKGNGISAVNCEKTGTSGAVDTYTLTISEDDGTVNTFALEVTNGSVTSVNGRTGAVTGLAEDNGYYEDMTVGGAEQLISSTYVEDSVPYVFRTSGGSADIGDREFDEIVGGTIAWNQLAPLNNVASTENGVTYTPNGDGTYSVSGTSTAVAIKYVTTSNAPILQINHVYLVTGCPVGGSNNTWQLSLRVNGGSVSLGADLGSGLVTKHTRSDAVNNTMTLLMRVNSGVTLDNKWTPQVFDLTQMFGSAIADYIYSLEQANAGAGVACFKSLFPNPYYPYNTGELISISGLSAHKMTGFNQWDEDAEIGNILSNTGQNGTATNVLRTKNYIPILPKTNYYNKVVNWSETNLKTRFYDADKNYIGYNGYNNATVQINRVFTTPENAYFMRFVFSSGYGTTYNHDICINLHWDGERDGEYAPYEAHEYALDSDVTLRGIPKLDADNELYFDGDIYQSDGTVQRRFGIVDLGSIDWLKSTNNTFSSSAISSLIRPTLTIYDVPTWLVNAKYGYDSASNVYGGDAQYNKCITVNPSGTIIVNDSAYSSGDATAFKTAMNGVYLVYELATPTTESAEPYTSPQWVDDFGTEEYVIAEQSGVAIPVGHETKYTANLKAKLEMAPNSPSGDGDYIVRQTGGINTYVPLTERIPNAPSENGNYILKCTVSGSTVTYTWESAT